MQGIITQTPQIVQVKAVGARIILVRWTPISDDSIAVTGYRVTAVTSTNETTVAFTEELDFNVTSFMFHGLSPYQYTGTPGITYNVSVIAFNNDGGGPKSEVYEVLLPRKYNIASILDFLLALMDLKGWNDLFHTK